MNLDIFFVLDGSGSIGETDFGQVRQFEHGFVKQLRIGPDDNQPLFSVTPEMLFSI